MVDHLKRSEDFELALRTRRRASSAHFALHHVGLERPSDDELSTGVPLVGDTAVEDARRRALGAVTLGAVVPKRHARRAVTRSLLKRQIRCAVDERSASLPRGIWVVRLRAPFDRSVYPSAASDALRRAARAELHQLLARVVSA